MSFFIREYEREGTAYVCFLKGKWNGSSAWKDEKESMQIDVGAMEFGGETKLAIEELSEWAWENFERWDESCIVGV